MDAEEDTDELESETIGYFVHQGHQPTICGVDQEILRSALAVAEDCRDFGVELLAIHDANLGRERKRHKMMAMELEKSIANAFKTIEQMRAAMGWPAV
jgi:hypothetical protein